MTENDTQLPKWLSVLGRYTFPVTLLVALDVLFERTLLTWLRGEQMVGFSMIHLLGPLVLLGLLSVLASHVFLVALAFLVVSRRLQHQPEPNISWPVVFTLLLLLSTLYVPYGAWRRITITVLGPGPRAAQFLVWAAHDGDRPMVELLLNRGVSVDALNGTSTALNGACAGRQMDLARFLLSKGADPTRAPDCRDMLLVLQKP